MCHLDGRRGMLITLDMMIAVLVVGGGRRGSVIEGREVEGVFGGCCVGRGGGREEGWDGLGEPLIGDDRSEGERREVGVGCSSVGKGGRVVVEVGERLGVAAFKDGGAMLLSLLLRRIPAPYFLPISLSTLVPPIPIVRAPLEAPFSCRVRVPGGLHRGVGRVDVEGRRVLLTLLLLRLSSGSVGGWSRLEGR